jgi:hypothetical protein
MNFGLKDSDLNYIRQIVKIFPKLTTLLFSDREQLVITNQDQISISALKERTFHWILFQTKSSTLEDMGPLLTL